MKRRGAALAAFAVLALGVGSVVAVARADTRRSIAGSLQLDYLYVPNDPAIKATSFDGLTAELSLKMSIDFTSTASASVKVCFACHGFEAAAAFADLRAAEELTVRVGRLTPEFGSFPQRGDPANHRSNDKPLPYDMGRMLHRTNWNESVLPAPWVDNGAELLGTHFINGGRLDYAAYVLSGPKGDATTGDIDFVASRGSPSSTSKYYVDNNSEPVIGARISGTADLDSDGHDITVGASAMAGHYDPEGKLGFVVAGADVVANLANVVLRGEYLMRRTDISTGASPALWRCGGDAGAACTDHFTKHGFYVEAEVPLGAVDAFARFDGLIRNGSALIMSGLSSHSTVVRYTTGAAVRVSANVRVKASIEYYDFNDFKNDVALHLGVATPF